MPPSSQFNTKSPTIKRILKEASELASNSNPDYHAEPLESNLFEWHFTLRGPPAPSAYAGGIYHGRIVLPPSYPLRPPSFRFLTPSGRFEVNREICLSISGHHEETWQPAWGIRTALVAIRSFMDTDAKGQVGGMDCNPEVRKRMAVDSPNFLCPGCGKSNGQIMTERGELAKAKSSGAAEKSRDVIPEELRLAYREELAERKDEAEAKPAESPQPHFALTDTGTAYLAPPIVNNSVPANAAGRPAPAPVAPAAPLAQRAPANDEAIPPWLDKAIYGVLAALVLMILRKIVF